MPRIPNPYIAGRPVSGPNFYGRQDIFRFVQNTFSSPHQNVVVLWGQRRMGKTSVLHELPSRLSPEFHPIYLDLQDKAQQRLNEVLYDLAREIAGSLNLDSPPRDNFLRDDDYFHERFLPQVYQSLGPRRLLLMFDEFDVLDMLEEELAYNVAVQAFFPYLRRALMQDEQLVFVFVVGRRLDELDELLQSTFKMAKTASVSFLEEAEARQLVVKPASGILEYDEEAIGRILSVTACHPYLTQLICSELFSYVEAAGRTRVTVGDVEAIVNRAIAAGGAGLAWLWVGLPTAERFVLSTVAHAAKEGRAATQDEIVRILEQYRVPFSGPELTQAPDMLIRWGLLRRTADGYEFVVELLRRWILSEHSLEQAKRELESVSPRATRLYELASELHRIGELDGAIRLYERALVINPNHVQARLGLAQALLERDRIDEAIKEYTEAYHLNEVMARDGLIAALQKRAEALEKTGKTDEPDQEYKTILNIAPDDLRVRKWVANRWTARGRKYLREDRYEEAIAEYEKATAIDGPDAREGLIAARRTLAETLERESRVNEADQQYKAILSIAPDDNKLKEWVAGCWMARGKKYLGRERYKDAVAEYDRAVALEVLGARKDLIAARRAWAEALEREDKAGEADQQYDAILGIAPDDARVREWIANSLIRRGDRYLEEGRYDEASQAYDQTESIQPEKQQALAQRRHQLELAPDYDRAMRAHKARDWATAEKEWVELYRKDRNYARRGGKTVAILLAEAIEKREKGAKRRWRLAPFLSGLALVFIVLILGFWIGLPLLWPPRPTLTPTTVMSITPGTPIAIVSPTNTATLTPSPTATVIPIAPSPTATVIPIAPSPTATVIPITPSPTATVTPTPLPTATVTPTPSFTATATPSPTPLPMPLGSRSILDVDVNAVNNEIMYVIARGEGIYKTIDGGYRWKLIRVLSNVGNLTLGRANPQTVLAAADRFILKSTDGGGSWHPPLEIKDQRTGQVLKGAIHVLAVAPDNERIVYAGTDGGVYRSDDGGVNWESRNGSMWDRPIHTLVVVSGDGQLVYAAGEGAEIWLTFDGGNFWNKLPLPGEIGAIYTLGFHPAFDYGKNWLYIGANNSTVAVSVDGGHNWRSGKLGNERPPYLRDPLKVMAVTILDFRDSETILLAATGDRENLFRNGIYKSTDGGRSWLPRNNGLPTDSSGTYSVHSITVDPKNNQIVYAGTFSGLYKSTNGGESWMRIP